MKLSPNFTLDELCESQTASRKNIDNTPSEEVVANLKTLALNVLQPIREHYSVPVIISSGYRSPKLNRAIGGSKTSQHCLGEAADLSVVNVSILETFEWCRDNLRYDQLILEFHDYKRPYSGWVHISYREGKNRQQVLEIGCKNKPKP